LILKNCVVKNLLSIVLIRRSDKSERALAVGLNVKYKKNLLFHQRLSLGIAATVADEQLHVFVHACDPAPRVRTVVACL
jgi:hypothetical protein